MKFFHLDIPRLQLTFVLVFFVVVVVVVIIIVISLWSSVTALPCSSL